MQCPSLPCPWHAMKSWPARSDLASVKSWYRGFDLVLLCATAFRVEACAAGAAQLAHQCWTIKVALHPASCDRHDFVCQERHTSDAMIPPITNHQPMASCVPCQPKRTVEEGLRRHTIPETRFPHHTRDGGYKAVSSADFTDARVVAVADVDVAWGCGRRRGLALVSAGDVRIWSLSWGRPAHPDKEDV